MESLMEFAPQDPEYRARVEANFARQRVMGVIGAKLVRVDPGEVEIAIPYYADLTQQHGFMHAGVIATILDSACGYAAFSLMPADVEVLTVEYKINLLRPAAGEQFVARGQVLRAGKNLTVCLGNAYARGSDGEKLVATMLATLTVVRNTPHEPK